MFFFELFVFMWISGWLWWSSCIYIYILICVRFFDFFVLMYSENSQTRSIIFSKASRNNMCSILVLSRKVQAKKAASQNENSIVLSAKLSQYKRTCFLLKKAVALCIYIFMIYIYIFFNTYLYLSFFGIQDLFPRQFDSPVFCDSLPTLRVPLSILSLIFDFCIYSYTVLFLRYLFKMICHPTFSVHQYMFY